MSSPKYETLYKNLNLCIDMIKGGSNIIISNGSKASYDLSSVWAMWGSVGKRPLSDVGVYSCVKIMHAYYTTHNPVTKCGNLVNSSIRNMPSKMSISSSSFPHFRPLFSLFLFFLFHVQPTRFLPQILCTSQSYHVTLFTCP